MASPRQTRRVLLGRWMAILDLVNQLEQDFLQIRDGVFTPQEHLEACRALQACWDALTNRRPVFDLHRHRWRKRRAHPLLTEALRRLKEWNQMHKAVRGRASE